MQIVIRYSSRVGDARPGSQKPKPTTDWCCLAGRLRKHARRQLGACAASSLALSLVEDTVQLEPSFQPELGWRTDFWDMYQMGRVIGSGSFGQVHAGVHRESGLPVAIKTLTKVRGKLPRDRTLERLNREAGILQRLQPCDGVIRLLGCFEEQEMVHVVTELCPSGDLARFVEVNGPVTERQLALVALQVLKVVQACHSHGIIHGDVKPNNFCLRGAQQRQPLQEDAPCSSLRAIDFGCAQSIGSQRCSNRMGTPVYMAPEIFARSYSHKVDIWSMGIMLYWLFCGKFPFFKDVNALNKAQLDEVANAVTNDPITYNFGPWQDISSEGLDFVNSCLTRPEEARMDTMEALQHPWLQMYVSPEELLGQRPGSARTSEEPALELPWYLQIVLPWN